MARTAKAPPTLKPSSRADLEARRNGSLGRGPSGLYYQLRQINLERHALAGGLPPTLAQVALEGEDTLGRLFQEMAKPDQTEEEIQRNTEVLSYLDQLVIASVIEPPLTVDMLGDPRNLAADSDLPPSDYQWITGVALRTTDTDAEGRRLFGIEPLSLFRELLDLHGCDPDCEGCERVLSAISAAVG